MTQAQKNYEKLLNIGMIVLLLWHMIMTIGKIFFSTVKAEMIYAAFLFLLSAVYIVLCRTKWTNTENRIDLITAKIRTPNQFICIVFLIWYMISLLINKGPRVKDNIWLIYDAGINCLLLFNLPVILSKEKGKKIIDFLLCVVSIVGLFYVIYGLWHLFTLNFIRLESGEFIRMTTYHTFEIGAYYNSTGAFALSFILIALYMIATQNILIKIFYALTLIPHTLTLFLTNSRAIFIACIAAYFFFVFLTVWNKTKQKMTALRLTISILTSAAAAAVIWELRPLAFQLFESVTNFSGGQINALTLLSQKPAANIEAFPVNGISRCMMLFSLSPLFSKKNSKKFSIIVSRFAKRAVRISLITALIMVFYTVSSYVLPGNEDNNRSSFIADRISAQSETAVQSGEDSVRDINDFSTIKSRERTWKYSLEIIKSDWKTFLFGVTPLGFNDAFYKVSGIGKKYHHAHNEVLNMGVSLGVPMMIVLLIFFISTGIKSFRLGILGRNQRFIGAYILPVVYITLIISTLVEAYLFASFTIMSCLFFLFCGWINALDADEK